MAYMPSNCKDTAHSTSQVHWEHNAWSILTNLHSCVSTVLDSHSSSEFLTAGVYSVDISGLTDLQTNCYMPCCRSGPSFAMTSLGRVRLGIWSEYHATACVLCILVKLGQTALQICIKNSVCRACAYNVNIELEQACCLQTSGIAHSLQTT